MSRTSYHQLSDKSLLYFLLCVVCCYCSIKLLSISYATFRCVCSPILNIFTKIVWADISNFSCIEIGQYIYNNVDEQNQTQSCLSYCTLFMNCL